MNQDSEILLEKHYTELCEKLAAHRLPRWDALPDLELYMDQVVAVMEKLLDIYHECSPEDNRIITPSIINNYVKLKVVPAPNKKRYSKEHLAYLIIVCILKQTLSISSIVKIMEHQLEKKSIDLLYNDFCNIYENVIPFVHFGDFSPIEEDQRCRETLDKAVDMDDFILKSAIISTSGKFICEGVLSIIQRDNPDKKEDQTKE